MPASAIDAPLHIAPQPAKPDKLLFWLAPDLALTFACLTLLSLFFMFHGATTLFGDSDTGWHIRIGERILSTGVLPHADPFSFSKPGAPWMAWEWGADVAMGAVYRVWGMGGIALMYGICLAAAVWMWIRLNRAVEGNFLITCLMFVPMLSTTALHWLARPHLFSWLFLLGTIWFCEAMPRVVTWWQLVSIAGLAAVWANLHASFFLAPVIALTYAAGAWLRPLIWDEGARGVRNYLWLAAAASLGPLINPGGWRLHEHVVRYLLDSRLLSQVTEFQSFNFLQDGAPRVMLALALCCAGAFAALAARQPARFILAILIIMMALRSVRALPLAALLLLPLANGSITFVLRGAEGLAPAFRRSLDGALDYGDRLQELERFCRGFALVPLLVALVFFAIRADAGFAPADFPVQASDVIGSLPARARILASDSFGGYLIYRFGAERKVFFDGRSDFYGTGFLDHYQRLWGARPGWRDEFNRWGFSNAVLPPECALISALESSGWRELYRDRVAVVLTGNSRL